MHLCRYIHANPLKHHLVKGLADWPYSNYPEWTGTRGGTLVDAALARGLFPEPGSYARFVEEYAAGLSALPRGIEPYLLD